MGGLQPVEFHGLGDRQQLDRLRHTFINSRWKNARRLLFALIGRIRGLVSNGLIGSLIQVARKKGRGPGEIRCPANLKKLIKHFDLNQWECIMV